MSTKKAKQTPSITPKDVKAAIDCYGNTNKNFPVHTLVTYINRIEGLLAKGKIPRVLLEELGRLLKLPAKS